MNKFLSYLNKPAPFNTKPWVVVIIASLLVSFLLGYFQPFGIDRFSNHVKIFVVTGYTLVTAISTSIIGYLFPFLFKAFYDPLKWTIWKSFVNTIFIILLIALGNSIFDWCVGHRLTGTFGSVLLSYLLVTTLIGIIPAFVSIIIVQNYALQKNLYDATSLNKLLEKRMRETPQNSHIINDIIELEGKTKETLSLSPNSILYLESSGNYINVCFLSNEVVKQKQIRNTISQMENSLRPYPNIIRCHRAFMVNISHINKTEGNSRGLQLSFDYVKEKIPVSRSYIRKMKEKLLY